MLGGMIVLLVVMFVLGIFVKKVAEIVWVLFVIWVFAFLAMVLWHLLKWPIIISGIVLIFAAIWYSWKEGKELGKPMKIGEEITKEDKDGER